MIKGEYEMARFFVAKSLILVAEGPIFPSTQWRIEMNTFLCSGISNGFSPVKD